MNEPRRWTHAELERDAEEATSVFREERLKESKLSATALRSTPESARHVVDLVLRLVDPHRFPWIAESRAPTSDEVERAVVASAAMVAAES